MKLLLWWNKISIGEKRRWGGFGHIHSLTLSYKGSAGTEFILFFCWPYYSCRRWNGAAMFKSVPQPPSLWFIFIHRSSKIQLWFKSGFRWIIIKKISFHSEAFRKIFHLCLLLGLYFFDTTLTYFAPRLQSFRECLSIFVLEG